MSNNNYIENELIRFDNVDFQYNDEGEYILRNCSFQLSKGHRLALKGSSGSGKTTLFRLILGFEQPINGVVYYKNQKLRENTIQELRKQTAWLPQDLNLGSGPVKDIFSFPFGFATNKDSVPDQTEIHTTLGKLGLTQSLMEKSFSDLSTGQRQRIGIALCFLLDKPLILLDEPTSALDEHSKKRVAKLLFENKNHTILSTSHDPWWLKRCDKVIELD